MTRAQGQLSGKAGKLSSAHIRKQKDRNFNIIWIVWIFGSVHIRKQQARNIRRSFKVKKFYTYQKVEGQETIH